MKLTKNQKKNLKIPSSECWNTMPIVRLTFKLKSRSTIMKSNSWVQLSSKPSLESAKDLHLFVFEPASLSDLEEP